MKCTRSPDGSIEVAESAIAVRASFLVLAAVVPWAVATTGSDSVGVALGYLGGAFFLTSALLIRSRRYRFDKTTRTVTWRRSRLLSSQYGVFPFGAVSAVVAQPRMDDENPRMRRVTYRPVMLTEIGEMPLSNTTSLKEEDFATLIAEVRRVLGLSEVGERDRIVDLVRAGRLTDATSLLRRDLGVSLVGARQRVEAIREGIRSEPPDDSAHENGE